MFVGHLAVAFAAKRAAPRVNVSWFVAAVTLADMIWPVLVLLGIEHVRIAPGATAFTPFVFESYPWSHSLLMLGVWGVGLAAIARLRGVTAATGLFVALVVSHWVLDVATHAPDMPLWPGASSPHLGLGLWNSVPATLAVEGAMWIGGIAIYLRTAPPQTWTARIAFWSFVLIATIMWATGPWGPPPPTERALGWLALTGWIMVPWAWVADKNRANGGNGRVGEW